MELKMPRMEMGIRYVENDNYRHYNIVILHRFPPSTHYYLLGINSIRSQPGNLENVQKLYNYN